MRVLIRKILFMMICVSLAIANGFMPRHAHAMAKVDPVATQQAQVGHDHGSHSHAHHGHGSASDNHHGHDHGMAGKANNTNGTPDGSKGLTDNCCVASCSAIALIFASIGLSTMPLEKAFVSTRQNSLVLA